MKKKRIPIIIGIVIILAVAGGLLFFFSKKDTVQPPVDQVEKKETLDINHIPGFMPGEGNTVCGIELPYRIPDTSLVIEAVGQYSGPFVEDGSGEPVANSLALVVTNREEIFAEYADISFKLNDDDKAEFKITGIPGKKSALVLEKNKKEFDANDILEYESQMFAEREKVSLMEESVEISTVDNEITVKNKGESPLEIVYIRYKTQISPVCYLGGITYNCKLEEIAEGQKKSVQTGHFSEETSEIVMVETVEK